MITPLTIQTAINEFIKVNAADKLLIKNMNESGEAHVHPKVISAALIPAEDREKYGDSTFENYPYIATNISQIEHLDGEALVHIDISFGVYNPEAIEHSNFTEDYGGYSELWNMIETVRTALCSQGTINKSCRFISETFKVEMKKEINYPYWEAYAYTQWYTGLPVRISEKSYHSWMKGDLNG